jgi:hypothetical protein
MKASGPVTCILCGRRLSSIVEDEPLDERPLTLTCATHSDQDLRDSGLDELWGGEPPNEARSYAFAGPEARVTAVYEQGEGTHAVYVLLQGGVLVMVFSWGHGDVSLAVVHREKRALVSPENVPRCTRPPWNDAVSEGWTLRAARKSEGGEVELDFAGHRTVLFQTELYTWRQLGDFNHFLKETWRLWS